jgi:DNA-binding PadR family transcriptional regulator
MSIIAIAESGTVTERHDGPLSPATLAILLTLVEEERHGYAILKEVEAQAGSPQLGTGTLYAALQRLTGEGLIEGSPGGRSPGEDSRRRYYRITARGREVARAEVLRMARVVRLAQAKSLIPAAGLRWLEAST